MSKTLLQKAKAHKSTRGKQFVPTKEFEEMALAWCRDEITHTQIARALGLGGTGYRVYAKIALTLKKYLNENFRVRTKQLQP